jgi:hypothetical protein
VTSPVSATTPIPLMSVGSAQTSRHTAREEPRTMMRGIPSGTATTATRTAATPIPLSTPSASVPNPRRGSALLSLKPTAAKAAPIPASVSAK